MKNLNKINWSTTLSHSAVVIFSMVALIGCQGSKSGDSTSVALQMPNWDEAKAKSLKSVSSKSSLDPGGSLGKLYSFTAYNNLEHVVVTISGSGFSNISKSWDSKNNSGGSATVAFTPPPESFNFDIPRGPGRKVQILAVFRDPDSGSMGFWYGETVRDMSKDVEDVGVNVSPMGSAATSGEGTIAGQWVTSCTPAVDPTACSGPTGLVNMKVGIPGGGSMQIEQSEIFNGWFTFFSVPGVDFIYELEENGQPLFSQVNVLSRSILAANLSASSDANDLVAKRTARILVPAHYRGHMYNGSIQFESQKSEPGVSAVGFFGPAAASAQGFKVCFDNGSVDLNSAYVSNSTTNSNPKIRFEYAANDSAFARVENVSLGSSGFGSSGLRRGGAIKTSSTGDSGDACYSPGGGSVGFPQSFKKALVVKTTELNSRDGMLGFRGPFVSSDPNNSWNLLNATVSGNNVALSWKFLPGLVVGTNSSIQVEIFTRIRGGTQDSSDLNGGGDLNCQSLSSELGFVSSGQVVPPNCTTGTTGTECSYSLAGPNYASARSSGLLDVAVCPVLPSGKKMKTAAIYAGRVNSTSGQPGPPVKIGLEIASSFIAGQFELATVSIQDQNGVKRSPAAATTISISAAAGSSFYVPNAANGTCVNPDSPITTTTSGNIVTAELSIGAADFERKFCFKNTNTGPSPFTFSIQAIVTGGVLSPATAPVTVNQP